MHSRVEIGFGLPNRLLAGFEGANAIGEGIEDGFGFLLQQGIHRRLLFAQGEHGQTIGLQPSRLARHFTFEFLRFGNQLLELEIFAQNGDWVAIEQLSLQPIVERLRLGEFLLVIELLQVEGTGFLSHRLGLRVRLDQVFFLAQVLDLRLDGIDALLQNGKLFVDEVDPLGEAGESFF